MTKIAIIPARGGSKRLPGKNILPILGKPMLYYPIKAALRSGLFDQIIVSTEDDEIRQAARQSGARVMERPEELAHDRASVVQVCQDVLGKLHDEGVSPARFCCIYATALFVTHQDLQESFYLMEKSSDADVIMGVSKFNLNPVQALETLEGGSLKPKWPDYNKLQSQFQPEFVASNGTIYWADTLAFLRDKTFYADRLQGYEVPWIRAIDLDTPEDYKNAQLLAPLFLNK